MPRISVYVSDRRDIDIVQALSSVPEGDRSWYLKELIRDGLRYRMGIEQPKDLYVRSTVVPIPGTQPDVSKTEPETKQKKETKKKQVKKQEQKKEPDEVPETEKAPEPAIKTEPTEPDISNFDDMNKLFDEIEIKEVGDDLIDDELDKKLDAL